MSVIAPPGSQSGPASDHPRPADVPALARAGAKWSFILFIGRYFVNAAATAVLSRLLTPADFGIVAMAMTLATFCQIFADMGLGWVTIQRSEISQTQLSNLFWINTLAGGLLWAICAAAGPLLNAFFHRTDLVPIAAVSGAGLFLAGLSTQPIALMRRKLQLRELLSIQIAATILGGVVAVFTAMLGLSYWAIVIQGLALQLATLIAVVARTGFRVGLPHGGVGTKSLAAFGGFLTIYNVMSYLAKSLDNIIVGKFAGPEQLAFYSRAYFLMTLPALFAASSLANVMVPALAALKHQPLEFERAYRKAVVAIGYIAFPISAGLALTAGETIPLLYGRQWIAVIPLLIWLSFGGFFYSTHCFTWLFVVCGKEREFALWGVATVIVYGSAFALGIHWGTLGVAVSYALATSIVVTPAGFYFAHSCAGVPLSPTFRGLIRPAGATLAMGIATWLVGGEMKELAATPLASLAAKTIAGVAVYAALCTRDIRRIFFGVTAAPQAA